MGMSIDMAITVLGMVEAHGICIEAKDVAVETMRKYQQIMDIMMNSDDTHYKLLMQIKEVIEDGKTD